MVLERLVEMLHLPLSHAGELHRAELLVGAAVDAMSTSFLYAWGTGDLLL